MQTTSGTLLIAAASAITILLMSPVPLTSPAFAQVDCEKVPAGPARTDCYIGLSRIGGGNAAIAGTKAQLERDRGALQQATGTSTKKKSRKKQHRGN